MNISDTLVVNFFAGPGTGKSTMAADVFARLKWDGTYRAELAPEFAKDKTWERAFDTLHNQYYVFAKQHHRLFRVQGQVDVIVTDSPILLSLHYGKDLSETFQNYVFETFNSFNNFNVFLERRKAYDTAGRTQTYEEACAADESIKHILIDNELPFITLPAVERSAGEIVSKVKTILGSRAAALSKAA